MSRVVPRAPRLVALNSTQSLRSVAICVAVKSLEVGSQPRAIEMVATAARELPVLRGRRRMIEVASPVAAGAESFLEVHAMQNGTFAAMSISRPWKS